MFSSCSLRENYVTTGEVTFLPVALFANPIGTDEYINFKCFNPGWVQRKSIFEIDTVASVRISKPKWQ